jgi:PAS domain S-box-containing protein
MLTPFSIFVSRDSLVDYLRHLRESRATSQTMNVDVSLRGSGGDLIPVRLFTIFDKPRKQYRIIIVDDTERQQALQKAQREHQNYHELISSLDAIVWEIDSESGRTTYLSKKAEQLFGAPAQNWEHDSRWSHLHVDDRERVLNELARAVTRQKGFVTEYRTFTMERKMIWLQDSIIIRSVDGRLKIRGIAVDITERRLMESKAALAAEELERRVGERTAELKWTVSELESFSYTLSHDMRAPLRAIAGYAALMADTSRSTSTPTSMECLQRIMRSAERLDALVQDVLKYSGLTKAKVELKPINLNAIIPAIADETLSFKMKGAEIDISPKLLPVVGHEGFLSQCISNLLSNAAKFVEPNVAPHVRIWTQRDGDLVRIFVADNGIGIAPVDHLRIFKPFERCHRQRPVDGAGLGLAIVQRAAERMGGTVGVESLVGQGSKFWVQLQAA